MIGVLSVICHDFLYAKLILMHELRLRDEIRILARIQWDFQLHRGHRLVKVARQHFWRRFHVQVRPGVIICFVRYDLSAEGLRVADSVLFEPVFLGEVFIEVDFVE